MTYPSPTAYRNPSWQTANRLNQQPYQPASQWAVPPMQQQPVYFEKSNTLSYDPVYDLVGQLGRKTRVDRNNVIHFNMPLINQIIQHGSAAVPILGQALQQLVKAPDKNMNALLEGIYTAEEMAENGITSVRELYPIISSLNTHTDPLLQIYLAGFYREINRPETFGPMLSTLIQHSVNNYPQTDTSINPTEEVGGTILQQIANRTADETVKRLLPLLQQQTTLTSPQQPANRNIQTQTPSFPATASALSTAL